MNGNQEGAFFRLLCFAWLEDDCALPNDAQALLKLCKRIDPDEFTTVMACFTKHPTKKGALCNPRLYKEWLASRARAEKHHQRAISAATARWAEKPATPTRPVKPKTPPTDWLATLKANPIYAHIDWDRELGKIQEWHSRPENIHRHINQRFVANWVNKIEPPLANGHGQPLTCPHHPALTFADQKAKDTHEYLYHPKYVG